MPPPPLVHGFPSPPLPPLDPSTGMITVPPPMPPPPIITSVPPPVLLINRPPPPLPPGTADLPVVREEPPKIEKKEESDDDAELSLLREAALKSMQMKNQRKRVSLGLGEGVEKHCGDVSYCKYMYYCNCHIAFNSVISGRCPLKYALTIDLKMKIKWPVKRRHWCH